jgi:hypothetical protein
MSHFENHTEESKSTLEKDTTNTPSSDTDTEVLQSNEVHESSAVDGDIDESQVTTLPGTGGPDDEGDIDVDPKDLNL